MDNPLSLLSQISTQKWQKQKTMSDEQKQQRIENLSYIKAHFDVIAVALAIVFLGYQIHKATKVS